ncbi:MAG: alpha-galactosidase [Lentisphaeria bacterium]|nr:alpha-galactosidase [Lentisphaeria bacterium]
MNVEVLLEKIVGDISVYYRIDHDSGMVEFSLSPVGIERQKDNFKELNPIASIKFPHDSGGCGFGNSRTMRYNATMNRFRFFDQQVKSNEIITELRSEDNCRLIHYLNWQNDFPVFQVHTEFINDSSETVELELLESFALGGVGESLNNEEFSHLKLHRFRSHWCSEAMQETVEAVDWNIERYPMLFPIYNERFGEGGLMPTASFHPFAAAEDPFNGICWGAYLGWSGAWQMEYSFHRALGLCISGGLADRDFGHWKKAVKSQEKIVAPTALITCCRGTFNQMCDLLVQGMDRMRKYLPIEEDLPIIFNEWCTSWGSPAEDNVLPLADKLKDLPIKYLVMDAGWYQDDETPEWHLMQGDWVVNKRLFPNGIKFVADKLREKGLIPGIWFEAEAVGSKSKAWNDHDNCCLKKDGKSIVVGSRKFWDLNKEETVKIVEDRIVQFLKNNNFGYLKVDHNENVGRYIDNADSNGEGVRLQAIASQNFFKRLQEVNPDLVIENCASGGQRIEPLMCSLTALSSFSDAHELVTIPIIAASMHRLLPCRQNQIWAVLRAEADDKRLGYVLSGGMLGRICLSGDIVKFNEAQMAIVKKALNFYLKLVPTLKDGISDIKGDFSKSRAFPIGCQIVERVRRDGKELMLAFHAFNRPQQTIEYRLPEGTWRLSDKFSIADTGEIEVKDGKVILHNAAEFSGHVLLFERVE